MVYCDFCGTCIMAGQGDPDGSGYVTLTTPPLKMSFQRAKVSQILHRCNACMCRAIDDRYSDYADPPVERGQGH